MVIAHTDEHSMNSLVHDCFYLKRLAYMKGRSNIFAGGVGTIKTLDPNQLGPKAASNDHCIEAFGALLHADSKKLNKGP